MFKIVILKDLFGNNVGFLVNGESVNNLTYHVKNVGGRGVLSVSYEEHEFWHKDDIIKHDEIDNAHDSYVNESKRFILFGKKRKRIIVSRFGFCKMKFTRRVEREMSGDWEVKIISLNSDKAYDDIEELL